MSHIVNAYSDIPSGRIGGGWLDSNRVADPTDQIIQVPHAGLVEALAARAIRHFSVEGSFNLRPGKALIVSPGDNPASTEVQVVRSISMTDNATTYTIVLLS